ncbi:hypothetical protein [Nevskia soli]|uniref:hypothetical protein n=1 Tax=Nevskia soli TaxID=418856 RepID=UPI0012F935BA|nr:hypothetical protein [Nevskia soli]
MADDTSETNGYRDGGLGNGESQPDRAATSFVDSDGNTLYYDRQGNLRRFGLQLNVVRPKLVSTTKVTPPQPVGLAPPSIGSSVSLQGSAVDYPPSYQPGGSNYQAASRKAFSDCLDPLNNNDSDAMARAQRGLLANPPDQLKPDTGPRLRAYDPAAEARQMRRLGDGLLGAVSLSAAWANGLATMTGRDEETSSRWMEGAAELGSAFGSLAEGGLSGMRRPSGGLPAEAPTAVNAEMPYGRRPATLPSAEVGIKEKGAALEAAAKLAALKRGAIQLFDAKHGGDNGFDVPYLMPTENGGVQLHNDVVKAYSGDVPVTGKGSPTEIGTNRVNTRVKNEKVLADGIANTPINDKFTARYKKEALEQLKRGDVITNLVGKPGTRFNQQHIDFINNQTPYKMGKIYTLDPIVPIFDGDSYGTSSMYLSPPPWEKK